jgi:carbamoyl-phosphate synthase large subunit
MREVCCVTHINRRQKTTFLIGSAGTATAFAACTALRRYWNDHVRVIVMDTNPRHLVTSSLIADDFFQVSPFRNESFVLEVLSLIQSEGVDYYLPLFPEEMLLAADIREQGRLPVGTRVLVPCLETCRITTDKYLTAEWLRRNGLPTPHTALGMPTFVSESYCIKPRMGVGSHGFRRVSAAELKLIFSSGQASHDTADGVIVQEQCLPPEITVDVFSAAESVTSHVLCRERLEVKSGVSTKVRIFRNDELSELANNLATALGLTGVFCFQVMRGSQGWCVLDINTRPGAATSTCATTGNDFCGAMFAYALGEDTQRFFRPLERDAFVTRQYCDFLMT